MAGRYRIGHEGEYVMKMMLRRVTDMFFSQELGFRVQLFNVLATAGVLISLLAAVVCLCNGEGAASALTNLATTFIALGLMIYASRTGNYQLCYTLTIIAIFLLFFPLIFFLGGGYGGAMPFYFVFAVSFTIFMLEGKRAVILSVWELVVYVGLCVYAYKHPEHIKQLATPLAVLLDKVIGFVSVSVAIGATMFAHFRIYNRQQRALEASREEALHFSEAKSRFLANMSHEIRTPIHVMLGKNELILRDSDSEQVRTHSRGIQDAGDTLLTLVSNVLDMSKIEQGRTTITQADYDTADLIESLIAIGEEYAGKRGLIFRVQIDAGLPRTLNGDLLHNKQIVANFLDNAAKYTNEGSITLSASAQKGKTEQDILLCLSVADTGIGIQEADMPELFESFARAHDPALQSIQGTGLGLAIARELAEMMDGQVSVESQWRAGSVFSLTVPQRVLDFAPWSQQRTKAAQLDRETCFIAPGGAVLIVDDNPENLQVMKLMLSSMMLRADTAASGAECLAAVEKSHYDVVIMDYMMPDMDGVETLCRLTDRPAFRTPVVALTANIVAGTEEKLLRAGFAKYLSKPVMCRDLELALLDLLPQELVIAYAGQTPTVIDKPMQKEFALMLSSFGVDLHEGLKYLSGDLLSYAKLTAFFSAAYERDKEKIVTLTEAGDWDGLRHRVHALKSRAKGIGAQELSETAAKLERLCARGGESAALLLPVLYVEWKQAVQGLQAFAARMDTIMPAQEVTGLALSSDALEELTSLLQCNCRSDAADLLDRLLLGQSDPKVLSALAAARRKVEMREMREAEQILAALTKEKTHV